MNALTFQIHLLDPVLVNQIGGGDPNSAIGFDFIPGSTIRGALIGKYLQRNKVEDNEDEFRHLFLDGTVHFLNAYLTTKTGKRTLPTPLSWRKEKDKADQIYDFAIQEDNSSTIWEAIDKPFCYIWDGEDDNNLFLYKPATQIKIHTSRADRQKVTKDGSTIFRYHALNSGQIFSATILAGNDSDFDNITDLLSDNTIISLGKSHLAGYGRVRVEKIEPLDDWKEYEPAGDDAENIIVTLLSDAIVRDSKTGAHVASLDPILGVLSKQCENAFIYTRIRGGFNRTWNLPLPQIMAIRAGSVFVYKDNAELRTYLQALEVTGIGEKREDGFGRIAIDWHRAKKMCAKEQPPSLHLPAVIEGDSMDLAQRIVNRMMRAKLDQALMKKVNSLSINGKKPKNFQLSRIRVIARRALSKNDGNVICTHLTKMKKTAQDQFQAARIEGMSLKEWLIKRSENPQSIWEILAVSSIEQPSVGGVEPEFADLALEYTVRLIEGVLYKALKEANNE